MSVRRVARVAMALVVTVVIVTAAAPVASAGVPPPPPLEDCGRFAAMRDAFDALGSTSTKADTFTALDRAALAFRKAAVKAPDEIATEMELLAAGFTDLADALKPLRKELHRTRSRREYKEMVEPIEEAFEQWSQKQDIEALTAAQTHVQEWLTTACGFELGSGATPGSSTAACDSAQGATQTVIDAWKAGDRATASGCADDAVVAELFDLPTVAMEYAGCEGIDSNSAECSYRYEGGTLIMRVSKVDGRWHVTDVTGRPD